MRVQLSKALAHHVCFKLILERRMMKIQFLFTCQYIVTLSSWDKKADNNLSTHGCSLDELPSSQNQHYKRCLAIRWENKHGISWINWSPTYNLWPQTFTKSFSLGFLYFVVLHLGQVCQSSMMIAAFQNIQHNLIVTFAVKVSQPPPFSRVRGLGRNVAPARARVLSSFTIGSSK